MIATRPFLVMKSGVEQNDLDLSPGRSLDGSFRKLVTGFLQNGLDASPSQSVDGSFKNSNSVLSSYSFSGTPSSSTFNPMSRKLYKGLKDYRRKLVDLEIFHQVLEDWVVENTSVESVCGEPIFPSPFVIDELRTLDLAVEGILFQQLFRMPSLPYASGNPNEDEYLAVEDFLHAIVNGLWRTFWRKSGPLPFFVSCPRNLGSKFCTVDKAISRGKVEEIRGLGLISRVGNDQQQVNWDQVAEFTLLRHSILFEDQRKLSSRTICDALFYCFHILISRNLSKTSSINNDSVFLLVLDSKYGGVIKFGGDLSKLEMNSSNPYRSATEWIKNCAEIHVSPVERVWNKMGNANWGDLGTLQLILATFYSLTQWNGPPRKSISALASDHSLRLQKRWMQCRLSENENALVPFKQTTHRHGDIVELDQNDVPLHKTQAIHLKLKPGEVLVLDDQGQGQKNFQIQESLMGDNGYLYSAVSLDYPTELLTLHVGAHPSRLEPSWEDMSHWYQVQRQTKVLSTLKQKGVSCKYLPDIIASGRILHSGQCKKQSPGGRCDHPWCGTPILVTFPVGEPIASVVARGVPFSPKESIRCCRDCLAALRIAAMAGVQHGDISPENIIQVVDRQNSSIDRSYYLPISWGRAVIDERDSPAINLQFSSSYALQHGKLCPSSDAESLIYILYFFCGGSMEEQDSIESALQWRERGWASRMIQQQLGEVSAFLKAFADYVDSLCGTPYPVDYDIWLKRLNRAVDGHGNRGKMVEEDLSCATSSGLRIHDIAESSGT